MSMQPARFSKVAFASIIPALALALSTSAAAQAPVIAASPSGDQTITQPPGSSLVIQGNLAPQSVDRVLHAAQFPGEDIAVQATNAFNSVACSTTGPQSVEVVFPANAYLVSTHTIAPQPCGNAGQRNPMRILNMNGSVLKYTGSSDAFLLAQGSASNGLWMPLLVQNGQVIGSGTAQSGFHLENGIGATFSSVAVWGFNNGCGILFEDTNNGWTESTIIENATFGGNAHQICYTNSSASPGTGSFLYNTITAAHFDLTDGQDGILVNGNGHPAQLWGGNFDIKFNVTSVRRNPATVVRVATQGSVARSFWTIRGELTGGDPAIQNCVFRQSDAASFYNTSADILQSGIANSCGFDGANSQNHALNLEPNLSWQPEGYVPQSRVTKWTNHTGNVQGYTRIFAAAPGSEHDGGLQLTSRANPSRGNQESDTVTSIADAPIKNVLDCEAASGGACGFGPGWSDTTGTGYNIATLICSNQGTGTVTLSSASLATGYNETPAILSGGTTQSSGAAINGVTSAYISAEVGARTFTLHTANCRSQSGGVLYPIQFPTAAVDTTSLRVGPAARSTVYHQLATFTTGNLQLRPIAPGSCNDVSEQVSSPNGAAATADDMPFNVIAPSMLGSSPVSITSPYRSSTGRIILRFCNYAATNSWTPPPGVYTVVSIR